MYSENHFDQISRFFHKYKFYFIEHAKRDQIYLNT